MVGANPFIGRYLYLTSLEIATERSLFFVAADYLMNFINNDVIQKSITYELVLFG